MSANQILTLPPTSGSAEQALVGNGSGVLQYGSVTRNQTITLNHNSSSPVTWFGLLTNTYLRLIECLITNPFNGTNPTVSIGVAGNTSKYLASDRIDLKAVSGNLFRFPIRDLAPVANETIILSYVASSSTAGSALFIAHFFG